MPNAAPHILIDGSGWLYRAFFALPNLTTPTGTPIGAVYGMGNMLRRLLKDFKPQHLAVIFDPPGKTFRNDWYADYKANRPPTPPELKDQFPAIIELVQALGIPVLQIDGVEADDVIGKLAMRTHEPVLVVSSDKDMAPLVKDRVTL